MSDTISVSATLRRRLPMSFGISRPGILVLDSTSKPVSYNAEALQILTYPELPDAMKQLQTFLATKVRSTLVRRQSTEGTEFVTSYTFGQRRYFTRSFTLDGLKPDSSETFVILLERYSPASSSFPASLPFKKNSQRFGLTEREHRAVQLLFRDLTTKEIAARMHITPNTVKAFLRHVMVKLGVSSRTGIADKLLASVPNSERSATWL